jgi:Protein of unknown function (DUF4197)
MQIQIRSFLLFLATTGALLIGATAQAGALDAITSKDASAGIKEALTKGAEYAVESLGKENGFLGNAQVKIPLPASLAKAEKAMRMVGMGKQADELVETMNRAAETAVAGAKPILVDSIKKMSVTDAKDILTGGEGSVTNYFKRTTSEPLTKKFLPVVQSATKKVQLGAKYDKFAGKAAQLGLIDAKDASLDKYVTEKALDGLYGMIAEKEKSFRANPVEAGSALLKKIFGAL